MLCSILCMFMSVLAVVYMLYLIMRVKVGQLYGVWYMLEHTFIYSISFGRSKRKSLNGYGTSVAYRLKCIGAFLYWF